MNANTLPEIFAHFGKNVKVMLIIRHGHKAADDRLTPECINDIMNDGFPGLTPSINVLQHGSDFIRTNETGVAATVWIRNNGGTITKNLPSDSRLGNTRVFAMYNDRVKTQMKEKGWKNYEALVKTNPAGLLRFETELIGFVRETFYQLETGDVALIPAHSPTVEAIYNTFAEDRDRKIQFAELEGIFLVQTINEDIFVYR